MSSFDFNWTTLFGETLKGSQGSKGDLATQTALKGKTVAIYFSAHWCPPCKGFTPLLSSFYSSRKAKGGNDFEVVFVSSDRDEGAFDSYFSEMPWLALPYANRELKATLSGKFKVSGIPTLVILSPDGSVNTTNGRNMVMTQPEAFPWVPTTLAQDMGTEFLGKDGKTVSLASLKSKYIGFYFSASWCSPCKSFTPMLSSFFSKRKEAGKDDFEIVFCSSDNDEGSYNEYYAEMPWLTMALKDKRCEALSNRFEVQGIPCLVIVGPDGKVVTKDAVGRLRQDPTGKDFPFFPQPIENIAATTENFGRDINDCPTLIAFVDSLDDSDQEGVKSAMLPIAQRLTSGEEVKMLFFMSDRPNGMSDQLKKLTETTKKSEPFAVIVDIPDNGGFYLLEDCDLSDSALLESFVQTALNKDKSKRKQLKK